MCANDGSIIRAIMTMPMNDAVASGQVSASIRIHIIDIVQPPGIGIPCIADILPHQRIVNAALAAKSNAQTPTKARSEARSEATALFIGSEGD